MSGCKASFVTLYQVQSWILKYWISQYRASFVTLYQVEFKNVEYLNVCIKQVCVKILWQQHLTSNRRNHLFSSKSTNLHCSSSNSTFSKVTVKSSSSTSSKINPSYSIQNSFSETNQSETTCTQILRRQCLFNFGQMAVSVCWMHWNAANIFTGAACSGAAARMRFPRPRERSMKFRGGWKINGSFASGSGGLTLRERMKYERSLASGVRKQQESRSSVLHRDGFIVGYHVSRLLPWFSIFVAIYLSETTSWRLIARFLNQVSSSYLHQMLYSSSLI